MFALLAWTALVKAQPQLEHPVEHLGLIAIMVCVLGRAWCSLYIGGRKKQEIVTSGPYSLCRNPLYVFSFIGAFGIGAQTGSLTVGATFAVACWIVFRIVASREESVVRTPRFVPNLRLWRDEAELSVRPAFFRRTVRDGLVFLLALPVFEGLEHLQNLGWLDALIALP